MTPPTTSSARMLYRRLVDYIRFRVIVRREWRDS